VAANSIKPVRERLDKVRAYPFHIEKRHGANEHLAQRVIPMEKMGLFLTAFSLVVPRWH